MGSDDEEDVLVDNLVKAAGEGFSFSNSNFKGGATKADVSRMRDEAINENNNRKTARANWKQPATEGIDAEYVASIKKMEDLLRNLHKEISDSITKSSTRTHVRQSVDAEPDNTGKASVPRGDTSSFVASDIIQEAMRVANKETIHTRQDPLEAYMVNEEAHDIREVGMVKIPYQTATSMGKTRYLNFCLSNM
ncbi:unnamed protein product [Brassica oleracea]